jgi:hypothetical protein
MVERLLSVDSIQAKLVSVPGRLSWTKSAIENITVALEAIGGWVDSMNTEQWPTGSVQSDSGLRWMLSDRRQLTSRTTELMACHQQLSNVLSFLNRLEDFSTAKIPPTYQNTTYFDDIISSIPLHDNCDETFSQPTSNRGEKSPVYCPLPTSTAHTPGCPPPAYDSAIKSHFGTQNHQKTHTQRLDASLFSQNRHPNWTNETKSGVWTYQHSERHETVPELAGGSVCMSGSNFFGPVNPFEFHFSPQVPDLLAPSGRDETDSISELLGDLKLIPELPGSDPTPPSDSPPRPSRGPSYISVQIRSSSRPRKYPQKNSLSKLPALPRRRPVPSHTFVEPTFTNEEHLTTSLQPRLAIVPSNRTPSSNTSEQGVAHPHWSSASIPSSLRPASGTLLSSQRLSHSSPRAARLSLGNGNSMPVRTSQPTSTTASTRMQRQKHMLDLLGSIDL